MEKGVLSNIKKFYALSFLEELMFIIPVIVLFWQENGLSLTQIMLLQSLYALSIVAFEVPTGVFADKWGRSKSMAIGALFLVLGAVIYSLGHNFWQFFAAEFVWAIGLTFKSGADTAFIYDTLKQEKREDDFKKVWGNAKAFGYAAAAIASIAGGLIALYSKRLDWILVAIACALAFFVTLTFKEPKHFEKAEKEKKYFKHTLECFKEAFTNKNILFMLLFYSIFTVVGRIALWFYQPYMKSSGIPLAVFGFIWASFSIFAISGSKFSHSIEKFLGQKGSLWMIIILGTLSLIFMSYWFAVFGVIFIFAMQFIRGFGPPVIQDYTHRHLSSEKRATLMSIQSFSGSLLFAIAGPFFGMIADKFSLSTALLATAIISFAAFSALMIWNKNRKN